MTKWISEWHYDRIKVEVHSRLQKRWEVEDARDAGKESSKEAIRQRSMRRALAVNSSIALEIDAIFKGRKSLLEEEAAQDGEDIFANKAANSSPQTQKSVSDDSTDTFGTPFEVNDALETNQGGVAIKKRSVLGLSTNAEQKASGKGKRPTVTLESGLAKPKAPRSERTQAPKRKRDPMDDEYTTNPSRRSKKSHVTALTPAPSSQAIPSQSITRTGKQDPNMTCTTESIIDGDVVELLGPIKYTEGYYKLACYMCNDPADQNEFLREGAGKPAYVSILAHVRRHHKKEFATVPSKLPPDDILIRVGTLITDATPEWFKARGGESGGGISLA